MTDQLTSDSQEPDALPDDDEPEATAPDLAPTDPQDTEDGDQPVTDTAENDQPQEGGE